MKNKGERLAVFNIQQFESGTEVIIEGVGGDIMNMMIGAMVNNETVLKLVSECVDIAKKVVIEQNLSDN